ncbi:Kelch-type beta propeller [Pelomyxa schiedti]|nr:Kelch-type beta propeller [Pelomyxa schiedti]
MFVDPERSYHLNINSNDEEIVGPAWIVRRHRDFEEARRAQQIELEEAQKDALRIVDSKLQLLHDSLLRQYSEDVVRKFEENERWRAAEFVRLYRKATDEDLASGGIWEDYQLPFDTYKRSCLGQHNRASQENISSFVLGLKEWNHLTSTAREKAFELILVNMTHHSNAIEGNKLSLSDTMRVISGLQPLEHVDEKDVVETTNHVEVVKWLLGCEDKQITASLVQDIHYILLRGLNLYNGEYRPHPVGVGTAQVLKAGKLSESQYVEEALSAACHAHYLLVHIHPFADGNGRIARVVDNLLLRIFGFPPVAIFPIENRIGYISAMNNIQSRDRTWRPPSPMMYRRAAIIVQIFALNDPETLERSAEIFSESYGRCDIWSQTILVGTKLDLIEKNGPTPKDKRVPYDKAVQMAKNMGAIGYVELSSTTGKNHECLFNLIVEAASIILPDLPASSRAPPAAPTPPPKPGFFASLFSWASSPKPIPEATPPSNTSSVTTISTIPSTSLVTPITIKPIIKSPSWQVLLGQESGPAAHPSHGHVSAEFRGSLYIFGGAGDTDFCETMRFDLKSKKWLSPLPSPTIGKFAAMAKDMSHIYLFGGDIGGIPTNNLFHFNFETRKWEKLYPTDESPDANAPSPRYGASIIKYCDTLIIFGGSSGDAYFMDVKRFNLNTKKWEPVLLAEGSPVPPPRCHHTAFRISNQEAIFYVFGGLSEARVKLSDLWELCPTSPPIWRQHTMTGDIPTPQRGHVGCVIDNSLLMFGSSNDNPHCEISQLNFDSRNWTRISPTGQTPSAREFHSVASSCDNQVIVFGGLLRQVTSDLLGDAFVLNIPTMQSLSLLALPLSPYCWMHICSFLPPESIAFLGMCCKGLYILCNDNEVWRPLLPPEEQIGTNLKQKYVEYHARKPLWRNPQPKVVDEEFPKSHIRYYSSPGCFLGDGIVHLANCTTKYVSDIVPGDFVLTESLNAREVARVLTRDVNKDYNLVFLNGLGLTTGHPVLVNGKWMHPKDITSPTRLFVTKLYDFELVGGTKVQDHSVIINGLVVCTLGKDCGMELNERFPDLNNKYGTGYWNTFKYMKA